MNILWTMAKLCLLLASNLGFWEFVRRKWDMNVYFLPASTIAAQFGVLFAAGLLNYLGTAAELMYFGGLALLAYRLYEEKGRFWRILKPYANWGFGLSALGFLLVVGALRGKTLSGIDNFTHWAVVVKNLLVADQFPTFAQEAVTFTSYPLGSAATIYYFCRHVSDGEWAFMLGQTYMMMCMILPLCACLKRSVLPAAAAVAVMGNFFLCYNIPITELLVDTLLPLAAGAMLLFVYYGCTQEKEDGSQSRVLVYAVPMLFLVENIKSSGLFFDALGLVLMALLLRQKQGKKQLLAAALVLLAGYSLWKHHCEYVFVNSQLSQHAVSAEYFRMRLGERSAADMVRILRGVAGYVCTRRPLLYLGIGLAALACLTGRRGIRRWGALALSCVGIYFAWALALAGMYLLSMSAQEALELLSIERYCRTIDILLYYGMTAYTLDCLSDMAPAVCRNIGGGVLAALTLAAWFWGCKGFPVFVDPPQGDTTLRKQMESLVAEYGVEEGYSYLICDRVAGGYAMFALRYCLNTSRVQQIAVTDPAQLEIEKDYDYIFLLEEGNPILDKWVSEAYPEQAGRSVIQCIK